MVWSYRVENGIAKANQALAKIEQHLSKSEKEKK